LVPAPELAASDRRTRRDRRRVSHRVPRVVAGLARFTREVGRAEQLAQVALERSPTDGVPDNTATAIVRAGRCR